MRILNAQQIKDVEKKTMENQYVSSYKLIERAASKLVESLELRHKLYHNSFVIFCGKGNNGADGMATARLLKEAGAFVKVYLWHTKKYTPENIQLQESLEDRAIKVEKLVLGKTQVVLKPTDIVVDALFGSGLNEVLDDSWQDVVQSINTAVVKDRIAIDMPSGMFCDTAVVQGQLVVQTNMVYTFSLPKLTLLLPDSQKVLQDFTVVDLGLDQQAIASALTTNHYIDKDLVRSFVQQIAKFSHKGTFGHSMLIGGSYGKMGAVALGAKANLRTGSGKVTCYVPQCGYQIIQSTVIEAMVVCAEQQDFITDFPICQDIDAVGIGIGLGVEKKTIKGFETFLKAHQHIKMVLDADALNMLSTQANLFDSLAENTILTPHPKELVGLIGNYKDDFEKIDLAKKLCKEKQLVLVIKGAHTTIVCPDGKVYFNSTGNWGMATAGSGDVLTGMITALLARGYSSEHAAILGVYMHGLAGDFAASKLSKYCVIASDIIGHLPHAYLELFEE